MIPLFVYLDQNHWIYLAKDYWGRPHKPEHRGIAARLLSAIESERIRLPLSTIHFIEHLRAENAGRRQRLAQVFDLFSRGWHVASWTNVLPIEVHQAVVDQFSQRCERLQPQVFGKGFLFGLGPKERTLLFDGRTEEQLNRLETIAALPGATLNLLTFPNEENRRRQNAAIAELSYASAIAAEESRSLRKPYSSDVHRRAQYAIYTLYHQNLIFAAMEAMGRARNEFLNLGLEGLKEFWGSVPSLDVDCELILYRDRQWSRRVGHNDERDIAHLALAIPYCSVVVTERFWVRAAEETGLAKKYDTVVCADLTEVFNHDVNGSR